MSALETLRAAARHGVQITPDGDDLELAAPAAPPEAVLPRLRAAHRRTGKTKLNAMHVTISGVLHKTPLR